PRHFPARAGGPTDCASQRSAKMQNEATALRTVVNLEAISNYRDKARTRKPLPCSSQSIRLVQRPKPPVARRELANCGVQIPDLKIRPEDVAHHQFGVTNLPE